MQYSTVVLSSFALERTVSSHETGFSLGTLHQDVKIHMEVADTSGHLFPGDRSTYELLERVVEFLGSLDMISVVKTNATPEATTQQCRRACNSSRTRRLVRKHQLILRERCASAIWRKVTWWQGKLGRATYADVARGGHHQQTTRQGIARWGRSRSKDSVEVVRPCRVPYPVGN